MRQPTIKKTVDIVCLDRTVVKGTIYIPEGLRVIDFLNETKNSFIAVTNAQFSNIGELPFRLDKEIFSKDRGTIFVSKSSIKWMTETRK